MALVAATAVKSTEVATDHQDTETAELRREVSIYFTDSFNHTKVRPGKIFQDSFLQVIDTVPAMANYTSSAEKMQVLIQGSRYSRGNAKISLERSQNKLDRVMIEIKGAINARSSCSF